MKKLAINIPIDELKVFCKKWKVQEFAFFGSILREDFDPEMSDIDVLYVFSPDADWGWDIVEMREELEEILGWKVDLISKRAIEKSRNPYKKKSILENIEVVYDETA